MLKKSQTATEYLVILAVVIVIALIVVGVMGGIPSIGGGASASATQAALASQKIAITNFAVSDYDTDLLIRNNHNERVDIDTITIDGEECLFFIGDNHILRPGETKTIVCQNKYDFENDRVTWDIEIIWEDLNTNALYTQSGEDLQLVGRVSSEYVSTIQSNEYWNGVDGCWNTTPTQKPICTCLDLEMIKTDATTLGYNYSLQNSIDMQRCANTFGGSAVDYAANWTPIGTSGAEFTGTFDGSNKVVSGLTIDAGDYVGLFGDVSGASISNVGVTSVNLVSTVPGPFDTNKVGALIGQASSSVISNTFSSGQVYGSNYMAGGLVGDLFASTLSNSYSTADVESGKGEVGGLVGYNAVAVSVSNSYATGRVVNDDDMGIGGLIGGSYGLDGGGSVSGSYWINHTDDDATSCHTDGDAGCTAVSSASNIPIR